MPIHSARQGELEQRMRDLGVARYRALANRARQRKLETTTPSGRYLLREAVGELTIALTDWIRTAKRDGRGGRLHSSLEYLTRVEPNVAALLTVKGVLDAIARQKTLTRAAHFAASCIEDELRCEFMREHARPLWDKLQRQTKTAGYEHKRQVVRKAMAALEEQFEPWPRREKIKAGVVLLELLRQSTKLVEFRTVKQKANRSTVIVVATQDTLNWLEKSNEAHETLSPFYMPCIDPPLNWEDPFSGGYHTNVLVRRPVIKTGDRKYLAEVQNTEMPEVYDAINALQQTAWEVNPVVALCMRHFWENGLAVADMPARIDEPLPTKPSDIATNEEARKEWRRRAAEVYRRNVSIRSRRIQTAKILFMLDQFENDAFYYPYQADFRGRLYCVPFFLQPQGPSQARGLLRFAEGKPITSEAEARWLAIHGANCWGYDKVSFDARVEWVRQHEAQLREVHHDPTYYTWWAQASKPWEFLAFVLEWVDYLDTGFGFVTKLPIAMDGSNNGLQVFSLLLRDPAGAAATNCAPSGVPRDIYQDVADRVTEKLIASSTTMAQTWLAFCKSRVPRECAKRPVMTLPYGSTRFSCQKYVTEWFDSVAHEKGNPFGTDRYKACAYLAGLVWDSINETVIAARQCMNWLQEVARICYDAGIPLRWTAPSGFPVKQAYTKLATREIRTRVGAKVRFTKYQEALDELHKRRQLNGVSPNFIHSLDAAALVKTVNLAYQRGITNFAMIHDSFGTTCVDAELLARTLRDVYAEMFSNDLLSHFRDEVQLHLGERGSLPPVPACGTFDVNEVRHSPYFFA